MIELLKNYRDNHGNSAAVLMNLSKAFDTINHDLLFAKLNAYGVGKNALKLIMNYVRNRHQFTKLMVNIIAGKSYSQVSFKVQY